MIAIIGARPQFIKHAAVDVQARGKLRLLSIHTGQHYDRNMSAVFFEQLGITPPDYVLETGGLSHGRQTGRMMAEIEQIVEKEQPDSVLVYGDTNSTLAGALVAAKLHIPVAHVEAGLRSYNKSMPEEINRILTDHCSDLLLTTSDAADNNLAKEGIREGVHYVGDVMLDMILLSKKYIKLRETDPYYYCTLHRPYNVDSPERLEYVLSSLNRLKKKVLFPIHPRTRQRAAAGNIDLQRFGNITFTEPAAYLDNIENLANCSGLITDSGGMQKEAYWLKKRCLTIRTETEWVETVASGWNSLMFDDLSGMDEAFGSLPPTHPPLYGDGRAAERIVRLLSEKE